MFNVLLPSTVTSLADDELHESAVLLAERYSTDILPAFPTQLLSFCACFQSILSNNSTVIEVAELLMIDHFALSSTYSDVCTAYLLGLPLTLPVTVAACQ